MTGRPAPGTRRDLLRLLGAGSALALIALAVGWLWGAWGALQARQTLRVTELRLALSDARARVLEARIEFINLNFDRANARLEAAKRPLTWARDWLTERSQHGWASRVTEALAYLTEAQLLGEAADLAGETRATQALRTIDAVIQAVPPDWASPW